MSAAGPPRPPRGASALRWTGAGGAALLTVSAWAGVTAGAPVVGAFALAGGVAGTGLLVLAWALLGRPVLRGPAPSPAWSVRTLAAWTAPLLFAPPLFSRDVYSYLAQGEVARRGLDPHVVGPATGLPADSAVLGRVDGYWTDSPSPYGPVSTVLSRSIAGIADGDLVVGVGLHRLAAVLGLVALVWAVPRLCALSGAAPATALWLGVLNPLVLWHLVAGLHNDALMLGLALAGTVLALQALPGRADARSGRPAPGDRPRWGPLALGVVLVCLGALVKAPVVVGLAVIGVALADRARTLLVSAMGMLLSLVAVAVAVSGPTGVGFTWTRSMTTPGTLDSWMAPTNWPGFLAGGVGAVLGADGAALSRAVIDAGRVTGLVLVVAGIGWLLLRQWRGRIGPVTALGAILAVAVALGPVLHPWYLLWAVLPLAAAPLAVRTHARIGVVAGVFAVLLPPLAGDFSGRAGLLVGGYAVAALVVAVGYVLLRRTAADAPAELAPV
ncbi:polyprenol phosphomannose-dependent alpha 1,6 mannosyltransferase MptB [Pseudonocardia nematodicida]|uniref:Polyprenol phosphomannose-dependent alpha 1,6 mannosyltransferase MptB n=1 Tax=Pseudonocardia nematodicida TaxID=1206997 RepID=A0ABV1KA14_9PSEU